jgi:hypothetical protein
LTDGQHEHQRNANADYGRQIITMRPTPPSRPAGIRPDHARQVTRETEARLVGDVRAGLTLPARSMPTVSKQERELTIALSASTAF